MFMYLKRLESVGFKSFAERVNIEFVPGMTAIVGPNGSGKSNITDAIKWVLGEQSIRALRGSKMEDIIFQGSETRNPLNVAEVTLILDNSDATLPIDYDEVSVTRRVYRSGDSEFYINKQSCRLRDIIDLFMDSGLGREAFTIISQGKVEEVLSSHAMERRVIFEEAAGVLKYKQRKEKAEFKLKETEENLSRVDDIIYEIEQQIEPLKEQSEKAKKYLQKTKQLKEKEIALLVNEIENIHQEWEQLKKEVDEKKLKELTLKNDIQIKEAKVEEKRQTIEKIDTKIEGLQNDLLQTTQQVEQFEGRKNVWYERKKHYNDRKKELHERKNTTKQTIQQLKEQHTKEVNILKKIKQEVNETKNKVQKLNSQLSEGIESLQEEIERQKAEYIERLNEQAVLKNEKEILKQRQIDNLAQDERHLVSYNKMKNHQQKLNEEKNHLKEQLHHTNSLIHHENEKLKQLQNQHYEQQRKQKNREKKLYHLYEKKAELRSRKSTLKEMQEDFQGFFYGVRNVLKARDDKTLKHIYGAVVELIHVPEEYTTAIETSLGSQAQNIVVPNEKTARYAIEWLKRNRKGRATFLPLQTIRSRMISEHLLRKINTHPGFINIAGNLVQTEEKFLMILHHLLGNVVIAQDLQAANDMAKILQHRYRMVTLDGDVVNPGGSMTGGGQQRKSSSLFTREKNLEKVEEQLRLIQEKIDALNDKFAEGKDLLATQEKKIDQQKKLLEEKHSALQTLERKQQTLSMELKTTKERLQIISTDRKLTDQDKEHLKEREREIEEQLKKNEQKSRAIQQHIKQLTEKEATFSSQQEKVKSTLHQHEILLAEQEEKMRNQQERTMSIEKEGSTLQEEYDRYKQELKELEQSLKQEETAEEIDEKITEVKRKKDLLLSEIKELRFKRSEDTEWIADEERELKEQSKQHQSFIKEIQQKEVQVNRLDVALENRLTKLQTDYQTTFERAKSTSFKITDPEQSTKEVESLKQKIKNLGTVNIGAIDEYKRLSDRYQFLSQQKDDLVEAKETLFSIIAEMDQVMKERFQKTFKQIQKEFSIVFKELFAGGHATLSLTDPDNLLETGIDIIAQPPGKKLQQLDLLSGGERALTAIALLFAILRTRPVPFCVLDEVEASLDEVNVTRFAKYVKMHSDHTQFIVITHQKGTMEEADVLYGVTMQESGVSRLVSVQLEETEEFVSSS